MNNLDSFDSGQGSEEKVFTPIVQGELGTESFDIDRAMNFLMGMAIQPKKTTS